jgi:asparagine synthase (glutamine-hydrolysing)
MAKMEKDDHGPIAGFGGFFGVKAPSPSDATQLDDWLLAQGAERLLTRPQCRVWRIGSPFGGLASIVVDPCIHALLVGDLFRPQPTSSDGAAQIIRDGHRRRGPQLVWDLVGQFALMLWDNNRRELAFFRDGSSAQTLFCAQGPGGSLCFADRLSLLAGCPLLTRRLSRPALHEYLRFLDISTPHTIYDGMLSAEPDRLYVHGPQGLRWSDGPAGAVAQSSWTLGRAADELDRRLFEAVADRLADVDATVCFLSGGVDSAYLCALASEQAPGRITALTVGFDEPRTDESTVARRIAEHIGVPHRVLRFDLDSCRRAFDALAEGAEYPFADPAGVPTLLAYREARGLAKHALDGTGADTLLGMMPARHQRIAVEHAARLPYGLRRVIARLMAALPTIRDYRPLLAFGDPEEVLVRWGGFSRREIERLCGEAVRLDETRFYRIFRGYPRSAHFERYSALMGNLPDDRIHTAAALTGLKVRFPFFEPQVAALIGSLERDHRWRPEEPKRVLRAALSKRIPRPLWDVPKHGFDFPFVALLTHRDAKLVRDYLDPIRVSRAGLIDPETVAAMVRDFIAGRRDQVFRVWGLAVLYAWIEAHGL